MPQAVRKGIAQAKRLPPYVVFSDKTLRAMARARPMDLTALLRCPGVGDAKLAAYGTVFVEAIRRSETKECPGKDQERRTRRIPPLCKSQAREKVAVLKVLHQDVREEPILQEVHGRARSGPRAPFRRGDDPLQFREQSLVLPLLDGQTREAVLLHERFLVLEMAPREVKEPALHVVMP